MQANHTKLGAVRSYAEGGLVTQIKRDLNKLVGNNPDAMKQRGRSAQIEAPPATSVPAGYSSGTPTKDNPAGIKFAKGGEVNGKGTGTSDDIHIMASNGEYMVKAAAVKKLGVPFMNKLNAIADGDKASAKNPRLGAVKGKYEVGGGVTPEDRLRQMNMKAVGARTTPSLTGAQAGDLVGKNPMLSLVNEAMTANGRSPANPIARPPLQIGYTPPTPSTALVDIKAQNFVRPGIDAPLPSQNGFQQVGEGRASSSAPTRATAAPRMLGYTPPPLEQIKLPQGYKPPPVNPATGAYIQPSAAASTPVQAPSMASRALGAVKGMSRAAAGGALLSAVPEAISTAQVAQDPNATGIDVGTQAAEGVGRVAAATAGAGKGAALGSVFGPVGTVVGGVAGGALGYYGADKAIQYGRSLVGTDPTSPVDRIQAPVAPVAAAPAGAVPPRIEGRGNGQRMGMQDPRIVTPQLQAAPQPQAALGEVSGQVTRDGNSYSGGNVSGLVNFVDKNGNARPSGGGFVAGTGDGTFTYGGSSNRSNLDGQVNAALDAAAARGDTEALRQYYGGNFGTRVAGDDAEFALMNNGKPMTARKLGAISKARAERAATGDSAKDRAFNERKFGAEQAGRGEDRKLAREKFDVDAAGAKLDQASKARLDAAQAAIADPKSTPEQRKTAVEVFDSLMGRTKVPAKPLGFKAISAGTDARGNPLPPVIYSEDTGDVKVQQEPAPYADGTKIKGKDGKNYVVKNGKPVLE